MMEERCSVKLFKSDGEALVKVSGAEYRVSMADFLKSGVEDGAPCGGEVLLFLEEAAEKLRCIKRAFVCLSYSAQPSRRLSQKLRRAGFGEDTVEKCMALLRQRGYVDDAALCAEQAGFFRKVKLFGSARIRKELYAKGFDRECVDAALEALESRVGGEGGCVSGSWSGSASEGVGGSEGGEMPDEAACIRELLEQKFPSLSPDDRQGRAKAVSYLFRMGFSYDDINNAISALGRE